MSRIPAVNRLHVAAQYFLNHQLRPDEVRAQVRAFAEAGYECLYPHARTNARSGHLCAGMNAGFCRHG